MRREVSLRDYMEEKKRESDAAPELIEYFEANIPGGATAATATTMLTTFKVMSRAVNTHADVNATFLFDVSPAAASDGDTPAVAFSSAEIRMGNIVPGALRRVASRCVALRHVAPRCVALRRFASRRVPFVAVLVALRLCSSRV